MYLSRFIFGNLAFCFSLFSVNAFLCSDLDTCFCNNFPPEAVEKQEVSVKKINAKGKKCLGAYKRSSDKF